MQNETKHIVIIGFDNLMTLDAVGPADVFSSVEATTGNKSYRVTFASSDGQSCKASSGFSINCQALSDIKRDVDTVLVAGGPGTFRAVRDKRLLGHIIRLSAISRRTGSICSGAFLLAAAGLLDGHHVATHWRVSGLLSKHFPNIHVDHESIYVEDGPIWTSAGVTSGIDMSLAMVEQDLGRSVALGVARELVVSRHRPGYQTQFSESLEAQIQAAEPFAKLFEWIRNNLNHRIDAHEMAEFMGMSQRTFHRKFVEVVKETPARFVEKMRLNAARIVLEDSSDALKTIAVQTGYNHSSNFIQAFERHFGVSPTLYRQMHEANRR